MPLNITKYFLFIWSHCQISTFIEVINIIIRFIRSSRFIVIIKSSLICSRSEDIRQLINGYIRIRKFFRCRIFIAVISSRKIILISIDLNVRDNGSVRFESFN